jgi:hypothetical protein
VANIVIELRREMGRVTALLDALDEKKRDEAQRCVRFAELALQQSALADMYEALDDLKEIVP